MKNYISCKLIQAEPSIKDGVEGYSILYRDGYKSWCPKEQFEKANLQIDKNEKLASGVSIGKDMVKNFIKEYEVIERDNKTTTVYAKLVNGFIIVESSSCVDPANYVREIGVQVCLERIENKIWELLGFMLQTAFAGVKADD